MSFSFLVFSFGLKTFHICFMKFHFLWPINIQNWVTFLIWNNFYIAHDLKVWFYDREILNLCTNTTWLLHYPMVVFFGDVWVFNSNIVSNSKCCVSVFWVITMTTMYLFIAICKFTNIVSEIPTYQQEFSSMYFSDNVELILNVWINTSHFTVFFRIFDLS